jgi:spermidine/putrescine transport system permease protein
MYLPMLFVMIYSFNENKLSTSWTGFSLKWYEMLVQDKVLLEGLKNSFILTVLSCLGASVIGTLGALGMQKMKSKSKEVVEQIATLPIMIPEIILGMVFMTFYELLGMKFGMLTLVIAHTTFCVPYIFLQVKARLVGMDKSLEEAARDLGAGPVCVFFDITLPLILPAICSGGILAFAMSLDDVVISIFVTGATTNTLPIIVYTQMKLGVTPEINALCTIMPGVTLILVMISNRIGKK